MSIRVLGGSYRGRVLGSVPGHATRPLLGQAKQSLFNILVGEIEGASVWDLFAGTGATGIEALSRGAERVLFIEKAHKALQVLRANLDLVGIGDDARARVLRSNAWSPPSSEEAPDLIFLDPPYEQVRRDPVGSLDQAESLVNRLATGGRLIFHFARGVIDEKSLQAIGELDLRLFGGAALALIRRPSPGETV